MAVGFPTDKDTIDAQAGQIIFTLRETLERAQRVKEWLDGTPNADLEALGYSANDVSILKSSYNDMDRLARIAEGQEVQASPSNFFFWARHLTGLT
jgi:hypothetical protein